MTPATFRKLALALPDAVEGAHHQHPDFRVQGRVFATLHPDGVTAMVKVSPPQQQQMVRAHPDCFRPANGAWGRQGCTLLTLALADKEVLRAALTDAWQLAMAQAAGKQGTASKPASPLRRRR